MWYKNKIVDYMNKRIIMKKTWKTNIFALIIVITFIVCDNDTKPAEFIVCEHNWGVWNVSIESTCMVNGNGTRTCTKCSIIDIDTSIPINSNSHDWGNWVGSATCTESGVSTRICNYNSEHKEQINTGVLGHSFLIYISDSNATCFIDGTKTASCERSCGVVDTITDIGSFGHDWNDWAEIDAPTCTIQGLEFRSCNRNCGVSDEGRPVTALGHTPNTNTGFCIVCNALGYTIGDTGPAGGTIVWAGAQGFTFFTSATDTVGVKAHFLEVAPTDILSLEGNRLEFRWSTRTEAPFIDIPGTSTAIGTGRKNTSLILALDPFAPAARACENYSINGYTDWFLPSSDERLLFNLYLRNSSSSGWTSSQISSRSAYITYAAGHSPMTANYLKSHEWNVRAFRAF